MKRRSFLKAVSAAAVAAPYVSIRSAAAQSPSRKETLLLVQEYGPNSLDMQGIGSAQPVNGVALNCYDRLVRFKRKPFADGIMSFDINSLEPELAESWQESSDGTSCTFKLRDAKFHGGRPVTAKARCRSAASRPPRWPPAAWRSPSSSSRSTRAPSASTSRAATSSPCRTWR